MLAPGEAAPRPARPLQQFLTYRVLKAHIALNAQAMAILEETSGLTLSQWRVVSFVGTGDARTSRAIVAATGLDPAAVSRSIRSLEDAGMLVAERLPEDRRTLALSLTDAGRAAFDRTLPVMQARQDALFAALDPEERSLILGALEKLELAAKRRDFAP